MKIYKTRWFAEAKSLNDETYRLEIQYLTDEEAHSPQAEEVTLSANGLQLSKSRDSLLSPIVEGKLKIELISERDRQFIDLFAYDEGDIRAALYRKGGKDTDFHPFWLGILDPETWAEPYDREDRYITSYSFSDFSILKRVRAGGCALSYLDFLYRCSERGLGEVLPIHFDTSTYLLTTEYNNNYISSELVKSENSTLSVSDYITKVGTSNVGEYSYQDLAIKDIDGFDTLKEVAQRIDIEDLIPKEEINLSTAFNLLSVSEMAIIEDKKGDDNEYITMYELLSRILSPFGATIEQRCGYLQITDLAFLYDHLDDAVVLMPSSTGSSIETDRVYKSVEITIPDKGKQELYNEDVRLSEDNSAEITIFRVDTKSVAPSFRFRFEPHSSHRFVKYSIDPITEGEKSCGYCLVCNPPHKEVSGNGLGLDPIPSVLDKLPSYIVKNYHSINHDESIFDIDTIRVPTQDGGSYPYLYTLDMGLFLSRDYNPFKKEGVRYISSISYTDGTGLPIRDLRLRGGGNFLKKGEYPDDPSVTYIGMRIIAYDDKRDKRYFLYNAEKQDALTEIAYSHGQQYQKKVVDSRDLSGFYNRGKAWKFRSLYWGEENQDRNLYIPFRDGERCNVGSWVHPFHTLEELDILDAPLYNNRFVFPKPPFGCSKMEITITSDFYIPNHPQPQKAKNNYFARTDFRWVLLSPIVIGVVPISGDKKDGEDLKIKTTIDDRFSEDYSETLYLATDPKFNPLSYTSIHSYPLGFYKYARRGRVMATLEELRINDIYNQYGDRRQSIKGEYFTNGETEPYKLYRDRSFASPLAPLDEEINILQATANYKLRELSPQLFRPNGSELGVMKNRYSQQRYILSSDAWKSMGYTPPTPPVETKRTAMAKIEITDGSSTFLSSGDRCTIKAVITDDAGEDITEIYKGLGGGIRWKMKIKGNNEPIDWGQTEEIITLFVRVVTSDDVLSQAEIGFEYDQELADSIIN